VDAVALRDAVVSSGTRFAPVLDNVTVMANLTDRLEKGLVAKAVRISPRVENSTHTYMQDIS